MAALFTEPRKCSGITEDSTSLRDEEKNIQVAIQLAEKLVKGLHKCKAERLKKKKTSKCCEDTSKSNRQGVYKPSLGSLQTDLNKFTISLTLLLTAVILRPRNSIQDQR